MQDRIKAVKQITSNPHLNYFEMQVTNRNGKEHPYYMASRKDQEHLKCLTGDYPADGILIYGVHQGEDSVDRLVLVKQLRYPINDYIYELPAGLIDPGETASVAAMREYWEETGLTFHPLSLDEAITKPFFTSVGMTDESVATAFGYASGTPSNQGQEENEDITVVLADKEEVMRILREEKVSSKCAYLMLHFLAAEQGKPFAFLAPFLKK